MGLADAFNVALHVPALREAEVATVLKALDAFAPDEVRARGARARPSAAPPACGAAGGAWSSAPRCAACRGACGGAHVAWLARL